MRTQSLPSRAATAAGLIGHRKPDSSIVKSLTSYQEGVLAKGVSAESSVTPKDPQNNRGYWAQEYMWH